MIKELSHFILRLWRDDDGVVLALTVVVYLTLFVIGCSVYAVGEHLRLRIVLQNAADAAAYSTAVVQADAISRIAALNRAMAWDYVQVCKMKRECILDEWVNRTYNAWLSNRNSVVRAASHNCVYTNRWYAGTNAHSDGNWGNQKIRFDGEWFPAISNQGGTESIYNRIVRVRDVERKAEADLVQRIEPLLAAIRELNAKEQEIIDTLPDALDAIFASTCAQNLDPGTLTLFLRKDPVSYFDKLPQRDEDDFLSYAISNSALTEFGSGTDVWYKKEDSGVLGNTMQLGFSRDYDSASGRPLAEWNYGYQIWRWYDSWRDRHCRYDGSVSRSNSTRPQKYFRAPLTRTRVFAFPQRLTSNFFAGDGTLVAAAAAPLRNPLTRMMEFTDEPGIYNFFTPPSDREGYVWAVSAARAGYMVRDEDGDSPGCYAVVPGHRDLLDAWDKVNLSEQDWDAVLLPLRRARSSYRNSRWQSESAHAILGEAWQSSAWKAVGGGPGQSIRRNGSRIANYSNADINRLAWH